MKRDSRLRGHLHPPEIIAEIGVNHEGSLSRAISLVQQAARGGADAVKFQTYRAEELASKGSSPSYWNQQFENTSSQFELFSRWPPFERHDYEELASVARDEGVRFMSTPFSLRAVDMLEPLVDAFKIASADITNAPLIRRTAQTGKPLVLSTGAASVYEVSQAVEWIHECRYQGDGSPVDLTVLHCVLNYPTKPENANLHRIKRLAEILPSEVQIGYSDHVRVNQDGSMPLVVAAWMLGATTIEKHFTDDRKQLGNDHYHACTWEDLSRVRSEINFLAAAIGDGSDCLQSQQEAREFARRRLFFQRAMRTGEVICEDDLKPLRGSEGLPVVLWDRIIGLELARESRSDEPLLAHHLAEESLNWLLGSDAGIV